MKGAKVFISYAHSDRSRAAAITDAVRKADLDVWMDATSIAPGDNWIAAVEAALADAGYLIALISAASVSSLWVQQEWTAMLARTLSGKKGGVVIPVRLDDVEPPLLLRTMQRIDLFPGFDKGLAVLVGFLLSETRPAILVQEKMATKSKGVRDLTPDDFSARLGESEVARRYSDRTWDAWHSLAGHERLTDAVLSRLDKRTIRRISLRCVSKQDLAAFCFDMDLDFGRIGGETLNETILSLLAFLLTEGRLGEFVAWLAEERERCVKTAIREYMPEIKV